MIAVGFVKTNFLHPGRAYSIGTLYNYIIYLLPELKGASGGAKVIYNHSIILNNLKKNLSSNVIHLKKKLSYKLETSLIKS